MIHKITVVLSPLAVLCVAMILACLLTYGVLIGLGDVWSMKRLISKGTQLFLVLSIFPLTKYLKLSWSDIGFTAKPVFYREALKGFVVGLVVLLPIISLLFFLGIRVFDVEKPWIVFSIIKMLLLSALLPALLISLIEEPIFRGLLLSSQYKYFSKFSAIIISAICYAGLHFLKADIDIAYEDITLFSGFQLIANALDNAVSLKNLSAFFALFMVGIFLGGARLYKGLGLGFCIGCHTAWVFLIKITKNISSLDGNADYFYLVSSYDGVIGMLVSFWLLIVISAFVVIRR
ncbi:MAG: CPBP family glutamic-type intramembrane protease [Methylococcaceae bacterium]|nr:CPBP family glutamic-type intramembrane protease [Methylococcaceae bacterium]